MRKIIALISLALILTSVLTGCVLDNEVVLNKDGVVGSTNQTTTSPEKQEYYNTYFSSDKVGFETLVYTKMGDYSVATTKTENGNIKAEVQINKTQKLTSYYIDKVEYVEYDNNGKIEWYKTSGKTSFVSLLGSDATSSVKVEDIKTIKYISSKNGIDTVEIETLKGEKITMEIRESSEKIISMSGNGMELKFSNLLEKDDKISFKKPDKFTEKSAQNIQGIIFSALGA